MSLSAAEQLVRVPEATKILNVSRATLYRLAAEGKVTKRKLYGGRTTVFVKAELEKLIAETIGAAAQN